MALLPYISTTTSFNFVHPHKQSLTPTAILSNSITTKTNILFSAYSKSRPLDHTLRLFNLLPHRDTVTWNTIISAFSRHGRFLTSIHLFLNMLISSSQSPDLLTLQIVFRACIATNNLPLALQLQVHVVKLQGLSSMDLIMSTRFIGLYCEIGLLNIARHLFETMQERDVVTYAAMMAGFNEVGEYAESLRIFSDMVGNDCSTPNEFVFTCALRACAGILSLAEGEQIHGHVLKASLQSDVFVGTCLIDMYTKCQRMDEAKRAFYDISTPNVAAWNALMNGDLGREEALRLFSKMRLSVLNPDYVTFAAFLRALRGASLKIVQQIHALVVKMMDMKMDVFVGGALFERYVEQGHVQDAEQVFDQIHDKDIAAFNSAIQVYGQNRHAEKAITLFHEALAMGKEPNQVTLTSLLMRVEELNQGKQLHALVIKVGFSSGEAITSSLIKMYGEFDCLEEGIRLFDQVDKPDLVLWTALISGYSRNGESKRALELYTKMVSEGPIGSPNHYTFSTLLRSCANLTAVEEGKQIHGQIIKSNSDNESDLFVSNGLVDMYAKCGYIKEARTLFENATHRDLAMWNAMITGLAQHGFAETAIKTFHQLLNLADMEPNHISFVGVLSACNHGGLVEQGYHYFQMIKDPTIDHYACLINLVGRAGRLEEARNIIHKMPFEPNELIWSSLLAASSIHGNVEMAEYSAKHLLKLNPKDSGTYVVLSNIYAGAGRWGDVIKIRKLMKRRGVRKKSACSWFTVNGRTHVFHMDRQTYRSKKLP